MRRLATKTGAARRPPDSTIYWSGYPLNPNPAGGRISISPASTLKQLRALVIQDG